MSFGDIKARIARLFSRLPLADEPRASVEARRARVLAAIAAEPEGPRRDVAIQLALWAASVVEEPEDLAAIVEAIGPDVTRAFPDGAPTSQGDRASRARARAYRPTGGEPDAIAATLERMIRAQPEEANATNQQENLT